ncbi:Flavonol synthase/flavanone 3-hydroxylase [Acorus calamus]|uniref:Flavonol synthase/flavanone 3-hydroxylase n=1 Tax=Acorus calamus TaxID=4465 RepID=A0AAV9D6S9_ACOCL|nr:Flavonol synthase/flavanone 3-hydroxylase [Acorus calamus]
MGYKGERLGGDRRAPSSIIINHGVGGDVMEKMHGVGKEFFEMPVEDRACLYLEDPPFEIVRVATSFNINKEKVRSWRDSLRHPVYPPNVLWDKGPKKPLLYREITSEYSKEMRTLESKLLGLFSEALEVDENHLYKKFGEQYPQVMNLNYYLSCPRPDRSSGPL